VNNHRTDILLVDDDEADRNLVLRALRREGLGDLRVVPLTDGQEAIDWLLGAGEFADKGPTLPRLLVVDLKMPKLDGIEVLRRVRGDERTRRLPVVMLTSSAEERDLADAQVAGVNSYVVKPVDYQQFVQTVAGICRYWLTFDAYARQ
jgi:two-component system response regulator